MLPQHKEAFFNVANQLNCWIGLREPNPLADKWIGKAGYVPKSEGCKAKTSDNPGFRFAGLVVDPVLCPDAFSSASYPDALNKWKIFAANNVVPPGFSRAESGPDKGLVRQSGAAIHADFDLMAICKAGKNGELEYTTLAGQEGLFKKAQMLLNQRFGSSMIQHGTEFMYAKGVGARESEHVLFFGPGRKFKQSMSSMPQKPGTMH